MISQGVHARHRQGFTVGEGFSGTGDCVPELVRAGLALIGGRR
ncbi:putative acyl-CoA dehydrogenase [Streptomyces albus]|uniref:Putative acyl-CoA dehydrogenase n=1 Tax=Streptomyces albus (strain ATCC 21838 / DSM 41398 / FERM P-419 / JCM 4703 / NBRC 107858) TaxID=1081613 RepID=A0A0B5EEY7_STRA4|nr:putative acyl-CoA dehydrogenase [Streptomyces albus]AOU74865.1 putative acyl-CoA dehydrogenase [Streptomyces albus]AYN30674.1 putative acyl-CoA dehydrogenase [Streptomyces albus]